MSMRNPGAGVEPSHPVSVTPAKERGPDWLARRYLKALAASEHTTSFKDPDFDDIEFEASPSSPSRPCGPTSPRLRSWSPAPSRSSQALRASSRAARRS